MLFNSLDFAVFLPLVFAIYWSINKQNLRWQNLLLLVASYVFYGWWDWKFLGLILLSSLSDFFIALRIEKETLELKRKRWLWCSLIINLGVLAIFKYYNFFIDNFNSAFSYFGLKPSISSLNIILPVGISFYTFQTLSYTIDVYRKKMKATRDIIVFGAFVSFFPQLVAGPIERAQNLLPQFLRKRKFDYENATIGLRQILWGLFKKVVIADNCARVVNQIFMTHDELPGSALLLGAIFFSFQIYGDFSGYSDIAVGTSRLFGFNLKRNFAFPYFSRDIAEFWRRWHISLSTWFRDYVYIPIGGSQVSKVLQIRNTFIVFMVSGFWHGANWTFIFWGALNAIYFLPVLLLGRNRTNLDIVSSGRKMPRFMDMYKMLSTFLLVCMAWILFRAKDLEQAISYYQGIFDRSILEIPFFPGLRAAQTTIIITVIFTIVEWLGREQDFAIEKIHLPRLFRWIIYILISFCIIFISGEEQEFIYFQF